MKKLYRAGLIRCYWFTSEAERDAFLCGLRCEYMVMERYEDNGLFYLSLVTQYNNTDILTDFPW